METVILNLYKRYHGGKENAITRMDFMTRHAYWDISDRQFRQLYSQLPICTCSTGGFYPIRGEEIKNFREYMKKKAISLFERFNLVYNAHPELTDNVGQMELFNGKEAIK